MTKKAVASRRVSSARQATEVDRRIGQLIRERRAVLSLNQQQLADRIGTAVQQLHKYETGENRVSASRLVDIARELNVPVAWFFEATEPLVQDSGVAAPAAELLKLFYEMTTDDQIKLVQIARLFRQ